MKNMVRHKKESLQCMKWVIVDGNNTYLWIDPQINSKCLVDLLGWDKYHLSISKFAAVKSIIHNDQWNTSKFIKTREVTNLIQEVQIVPQKEADYMEQCGG